MDRRSAWRRDRRGVRRRHDCLLPFGKFGSWHKSDVTTATTRYGKAETIAWIGLMTECAMPVLRQGSARRG